MSNSGNPVSDLLNSFAGGGGQSAGSQAQFGLLLQLIQRIVASLEGGGSTEANPFTVYPVLAATTLDIASVYPNLTAGVFSIRKSVPSPTTVILPGTNGPWIVVDGAGNASDNPITVQPAAGFTILGSPAFILNFNWQSAIFVLDGGNYVIL